MAFSYKVKVRREGKTSRLEIIPFGNFNEVDFPPLPKKLSSDFYEQWTRLAAGVRSDFCKARLYHLLFFVKYGNSLENAKRAAWSYLGSSKNFGCSLDGAKNLYFALKLARSVKESSIMESCAKLFVDAAKFSLESENPKPGITLRYLRPLVEENFHIDEARNLLTRSLEVYPAPHIQDEIIDLLISISNKDEEKEIFRRKRVDIWIDAANEADGILRSHYFARALEEAEKAGLRDLVDRAAALLQKINKDNLGLKTISSSVSYDEYEIENFLKPVVLAPSWREALDIYWMYYGPATGDINANKELVAEIAKNSVLASTIPTQILGEDGLPRFFPRSEEDKYLIQLTQCESLRLQIFSPLLDLALRKIGEVYGVPTEDELSSFLSQKPSLHEDEAELIARSFIRYWTGDFEGAAFVVVPMIERVARNLLVSIDAGIYRLQKEGKPGQYPGLGSLLQSLRERGMDESWYRCVLTSCCNPVGGWNLRNDLSHGFLLGLPSPAVAVLFQIILYMSNLQRSDKESNEHGNSSA